LGVDPRLSGIPQNGWGLVRTRCGGGGRARWEGCSALCVALLCGTWWAGQDARVELGKGSARASAGGRILAARCWDVPGSGRWGRSRPVGGLLCSVRGAAVQHLVGGAGCARRAREGLCAGKRWWEDPRGTMVGRAWLWRSGARSGRGWQGARAGRIRALEQGKGWGQARQRGERGSTTCERCRSVAIFWFEGSFGAF
jgi:hypothetical protein